jgi:energy-coupling factor transporter ATP-binding protein EcfA2
MPTYQLQNLTVRHLGARSSSALQAINLTIEQGEQIALIGPSGAGKTTLLATLSLSHQPAEGSFTAFGADPWALGEAARHRLRAQLFLAPQTPPLPPRQRVVTAVLAARLPQWSVWRALVSLFKPADPKRRGRRCRASISATSCIRALTACPAVSASAAAWRACCCRRPRRCWWTSLVRARSGVVRTDVDHAARRSQGAQRHPDLQPAPGGTGLSHFPASSPCAMAASLSTCRASRSRRR